MFEEANRQVRLACHEVAEVANERFPDGVFLEVGEHDDNTYGEMFACAVLDGAEQAVATFGYLPEDVDGAFIDDHLITLNRFNRSLWKAAIVSERFDEVRMLDIRTLAVIGRFG